ncbi:PBP1A family penicillin-binding protein [bacterium]|nr:PBP1A family penicillin-binding protein [FCB group bacterium]MBL7191883.1 PBP1A family penicillin-binding protein [bacterium]
MSILKLIIIGLITYILGIGLLIGVFSLTAKDLPSLEQLENWNPRLVTRIISADNVVIKEFYTQRRIYVPLELIPADLVNAVLATEDRRFYNHWGADIIRLMKAIMVDIATLSKKQGASTITQQLARNIYFDHKQTISRKMKEFVTAIQIERHYSKREILEMYFTQTYYGGGAYGIQAASQRYFSKNVENLNLQECALLIAVLKAPSRYSPIYQPEKALKRRNLVLRNLFKCGYIDRDVYAEASASPIELNTSETESPLGIAPYFTEYIRQQLEKKEQQYGFDYYHDGLTVYTTLDSRLQRFAEEAVYQHLVFLDDRFMERFTRNQLLPFLADNFPETPPDSLELLLEDTLLIDSLLQDKLAVQAAFVALQPGTGKILSMIGGRDFSEYKFNRAIQSVRQPGSVFKPIVYLTAIDNGYPPTFRLLNQDVVLQDGGGKRWTPQNYDHSRSGLTTLREGLRRSLNLITVRLVQEIVPPKLVVDYARKLGVTTRLDAVDAIALGASGVIPLEIVNALSVFPAGGVLAQPYGIIRIEDRYGNVIEENLPQRKVVISEQSAYMMTNLLQTVINEGTGGSARWRFHFYENAAGKTGTTNAYTDAWFIGFTASLCAGIWTGLDDPYMSLGKGQSGARAALPIWARFMKTTYDSIKQDDMYFPLSRNKEFAVPQGMIEMDICLDSYKPAVKFCPNTMKEVFIEKYAPIDSCTIHRGAARR